MSKSGFFWNDKKSRFSLVVEQRFRNTSSKPIMTVLLQETNNIEEINNLFMWQLLEQNRDLREAHEKTLNEMEELKWFQGSTFDTIPMKKFVEDRDTILELTGKIQELQNEVNCLNNSRYFNDAESVCCGTIARSQSTSVTSTSSWSWRDAKPSWEHAEPQR